MIAVALDALRSSLQQAVARAEAEVDPAVLSAAMDECVQAGMEPFDPALDAAQAAMKQIEIEFAIKKKHEAVLQVVCVCVCVCV